jgi:alcohol dehydrogenase YqhD (iron-dependent ADH family)
VKDFVFHNPTKILFGKNTIAAIGPETKQYGTNVLLVYGRSSLRQNGILEQVSDSLKDAGCSITSYGEISPNPTLTQVYEGVKRFRQHRCDIICAAGGGSVIDTAKAISCAVPVDHDVWKFFLTKKSIKSAIPLTCVATVAGSGSESNSGMVITNEDKQQKFGYGSRFLYPKVSVINPEATFSVSREQTAYGVVDTIAHLVEFYCNNTVQSSNVQSRIMEGLLESVMESAEIALRNPLDYQARAQLLWAASLSLNGVTSAGLGRVSMPIHLIEHSLSALHNTNHGAGLSLILPAWMKYVSRSQPGKIAQLGRRLFGLQEKDASRTAIATANRLQRWFISIGCPASLEELQVSENELFAISENTKHLAKIWRLPQYDRQTVLAILRFCIS